MIDLAMIQNGWEKNQKLNLFLYKNIKQDWLASHLYDNSRTIWDQFDHIVRMRQMWSTKINNKLRHQSTINCNLKDAVPMRLKASFERVSETLELIDQSQTKEFDVLTLYTRLIAHEAHHRSQVIATIKVNDLAINKSVNYGLWTWGHNFNG